ncbi:MAG: hypothetical protein WHS46_05395 [Desulfosoma sp.]
MSAVTPAMPRCKPINYAYRVHRTWHLFVGDRQPEIAFLQIQGNGPDNPNRPVSECGEQGQPYLLKHVAGYNRAARYKPRLIPIDLDRDDSCAPSFPQQSLQKRVPCLCFPVVVRSDEAWLPAEQVPMAKFLGFAEKRIPLQPESLKNPKQALVNHAHFSRPTDVIDIKIFRSIARCSMLVEGGFDNFSTVFSIFLQ